MDKDILGKALLDYFNGNYTEDLLTETSISEEDILPLPYLFRSYEEMSKIEHKALDLAHGKVLDVGCGAGSHALYLQERGLQVTAIDVSLGAIEVSKARGAHDVRQVSLLDLEGEKFDTILLLMNGTGIFRNLASVPIYLKHLKNLLAVGGQILIDSSDLQYMFDEDEEEGGIWVPGEKSYYGELTFKMHYKGESTEEFDWLYLDFPTFKEICKESDFFCSLVSEGNHYDYLARLTVNQNKDRQKQFNNSKI